MNHNNRIGLLHQADDATAGAIMQQYPPQWDMDRIFQKAYQGYLAKKQEQVQTVMPFSSEVTDDAACTEPNGISRNLRRVCGYAGLAAAMLGVFLLVYNVSLLRLSVDRVPDETAPTIISSFPEETTCESTSVSGVVPVSTDVSETETAASGTESSTASTSTENTLPPPEAIVTEMPETGIVTPDTTASDISSETDLTTAPPETTTTETATVTKSHGQFIIEDLTGEATYYTIRYARESDAAVEKHEHAFEAEGFTLVRQTEYNEQYDFHSTYYSLEDENGQQYAVHQFQYDYFSSVYNPDSGDLMKQYTLGGKSAILLYQDDPNALCRLIWDDGCHVCEMYSQYKDLANMELLMQSQTGEKIVVPEFESYFKLEEPTGSAVSGQIVYVRGNSDPVQERTHSFAAEGFTLTNVTEYNAGQPYSSVHYTLEDENGQHYLVMQEQYKYFNASYDPDAVPLTKSYTIGGKKAFLVYEDKPDSICRLIWDDGCHVCIVISQYKDLANMELLVQSQFAE